MFEKKIRKQFCFLQGGGKGVQNMIINNILKKMEQDLKVVANQTTVETNQSKRPYNRISQEMRSQILHALTAEKLSIQQVAENFNTKPCTCKAILQTYELEGRTQRKTTRRERIEIESKLRLKIINPLGKVDNGYENTRTLKIYAEEKDLSATEEINLKKKLVQEISSQLGEFQTSCYQIQSQQTQILDERAPENVIRGINLGLHLATSRIREGGLNITKKKSKQEKADNKINNMSEQNIYDSIKKFTQIVMQKSQNNPQLFEYLRNLTQLTIMQERQLQKLSLQEQNVNKLKEQLKEIICNSLKY